MPTTSITTGSPASTPGSQASAEAAVRKGYAEKLAHCSATRDAPATIVEINWDTPGFKENEGGSGSIEAADPALGGEFTATYKSGRWNIDYHWC